MASTVNKRGFPWRLMGVLEAAASDGGLGSFRFESTVPRVCVLVHSPLELGEHPPFPVLTARRKKMNVLRGCEFDLHLGGLPMHQGSRADSGHLHSGGDSDNSCL